MKLLLKSGLERLSTGIDDLDTVLGGGFLVGGVVLVAGQPGIGKSTLLAQVAAHIAKTKSVLYVSGEGIGFSSEASCGAFGCG